MKGDTGTVFAEPLRAWVFSASFPAGIALLIFMRVHFGYDWPNFLPRIGLLVLCIGLGHLLCDLVVPELFNGHSQVLRTAVHLLRHMVLGGGNLVILAAMGRHRTNHRDWYRRLSMVIFPPRASKAQGPLSAWATRLCL
jgi:hypothetical protein